MVSINNCLLLNKFFEFDNLTIVGVSPYLGAPRGQAGPPNVMDILCMDMLGPNGLRIKKV